MGEKKKKIPFVLRFLRAFLIIIILAAALWTGFSLIGRISPANVIPDASDLYFQIPNPVRLVRALAEHEALPDILALPELKSVLSVLNLVKDSNIQNSRWAELAGRGRFEGVLLSGGGKTGMENLLAVWDMGLLSPLLKLLPYMAGRIALPGLYYVQRGKYSRFEFRMDDGNILYLGSYHNLMVISGSSPVFESVIDGKSRDGDLRGSSGIRKLKSSNFDIAFIFSKEFLGEMIGSAENSILPVMDLLRFDGPVEAALSIKPRQLDLGLYGTVASGQTDLERIIARDSRAPGLYQMVPDNTQYLSVLAAGSLGEILNAASAVPGSGISDPWRKADSSSRTFLGMSLDELLLSWTGEEFAIFGMEGREAPVILAEVRDERKRQDVFNRAFQSFVINENIQLNLDGVRIPRIELPAFLYNLLLSMGIKIPSPYYTVYNGYLFVSESAESLLAAVNGARRNNGLVRTALWQTLAKSGSDRSGFSVFYSLDRSMPFFLRGSTPISPILQLYRQGLLRMFFQNHSVTVNLSVIQGPGRRLEPIPGFPLEPGQRPGNQLYALSQDRSIIFTQSNSAVIVSPADAGKKILEIPGNTGKLYALPAEGITGAVWAAGSQGRVFLADAEFRVMQGFPRITGLQLSASPAAWNKKLYLPDFTNNTGTLYVMDEQGSMEKWPLIFDAALMSPPAFINFGNKIYCACYPKEFFGNIWLLDEKGNALPGWPVPVPGIAFGSPLLFISGNRLNLAFITQAGELSVYDEEGRIKPDFPAELGGVFYLQPVYDGEYLWTVSAEGILYRISQDGQFLSQKIPGLEAREEAYITLHDMDGDNRPEIFITGEGNALYGYNRNFQALEGFPLPVWGRPAFADFLGNGKTGIAGMGMDNKLYMWQFR